MKEHRRAGDMNISVFAEHVSRKKLKPVIDGMQNVQGNLGT